MFGGWSKLPLVSLGLGLIGAAAVVSFSALLAKAALFDPLRFCGQNSIVIYLAFFLPMAATRMLLLKTGIDRRHRHGLADRHRRRRRRRAGDLVGDARHAGSTSCSCGRRGSGSTPRLALQPAE